MVRPSPLTLLLHTEELTVSELPFMPLWIAAYELDTGHLTLQQDGAYMRLLRLAWRSPGCSIPDDPAWIQARMRVDLKTYGEVVDPLLREFFHRRHGRWVQKRQQAEWLKSKDLKDKRSAAGIAAATAKSLKKAGNAPTTEQRLNNHTSTSKQITNSSIPEPRAEAEIIHISDELNNLMRKRP